MEALIAKQPQNFISLLKNSLRLYRKSFIKTLPFAALIAIIIYIPRFYSIYMGQELVLASTDFDPSQLWLLLINVTSIVFLVAMLWHINCVLHRKNEPFVEDIVVGLKKVVYIFIASIIQNLVILSCFIVILTFSYLMVRYNFLATTNLLGLLVKAMILSSLCFALVYVATLFVFLLPIIAIENKGVFSAIKRSVLLAWNHWWRTFSVQLTPWICFTLTLFFIKYIFNIDVHIYFTHHTQAFSTSLIQMLIFMLFIPWSAALLVVQVHDLELRNHLVKRK